MACACAVTGRGFGPGCEHTSEDHGEELADLVFSCAVVAGRGEDALGSHVIEFKNSLVAAAEVTCVVPAQTEISNKIHLLSTLRLSIVGHLANEQVSTVQQILFRVVTTFALLPVRPGLHSTDVGFFP